MARKISVELTLEVQRYIDDAVKAATATKGLDEEMKGLDREVTVVEAKMDGLAVTSAVASKEVGNVGDKSNKASRELATLDRQIDSTRRRVERLGIEFAATGDKVVGQRFGDQRSMLGRLESLRTTLKGLENDGRPVLNVLEKIGNTVAPLAGAAGSGGGGIVGGGAAAVGPLAGAGGGEGAAAITGVVIGALAVAAPVIGALLGGAIAGAVGTVGLAGGILAATRDPVVKSALTQFVADAEQDFFSIGASFIDPVRQGLAILDKELANSNLASVFAPAAQDVTIIADGLARLVRNVLPGFQRALERSAPFATVAGEGLAQFGDALGYAFDQISKNKGSLEGLKALFSLLNGTILGLTNTITFLGSAYDWLADKAATLFDALALAADISGAHGQAKDFRDMANTLHHLGDETVAAIPPTKGLGDAFAGTADRAKQLADQFTAVDEAQTKYINDQVAAHNATIAVAQDFADLNEKLVRGRGAWDVNTQAGRDNLRLIDQTITDLERQKDAAIAAGHGTAAATAEADQAYNDQLDKLIQVEKQAGATKAELDRLNGLHIQIAVDYAITNQVNKANAVDRAIRGFAGGGETPAFAPFVVGENAPEVMFSSRKQFVATKQMMQWGGGLGGGIAPVNLVVQMIDPMTGAVTRKLAINDALSRGVPSSTAAAAYP